MSDTSPKLFIKPLAPRRTPLKGVKPRGYPAATPAKVVGPVRPMKNAQERALAREARRQEDREDDNRMWDRLERVGTATVQALAPVAPILVGAIGGAAAFRPWSIDAVVTPYQARLGDKKVVRWRVDIATASIALTALALDLDFSKLGGGKLHLGVPDTFAIGVDTLEGWDDTPENREKIRKIAVDRVMQALTLWGAGFGGTLMALAGSLGTVFRK